MIRASLLLFLLLLPALSFAGRGFLLNGNSAEALGMGGADVAIANDSFAVNLNPAGLAQIGNKATDLALYPYYLNLRHYDALGNEAQTRNPVGLIVGTAYAARSKQFPDAVFGLGLFVQGGTGVGFEDLQTAFGTRDDISSDISVAKLALGGGWSATGQLRLGASLGLSLASGRQKFFPDTSDASDPANPFFGLRFDDGHKVAANATLGLQYLPHPDWTLAVIYNSETDLTLTGGSLTVNYSAIGEGPVRYQQARAEGFNFPQQVDVGVAWQASERWLVSAEVNWLDWSRAISASTLVASRPDNANVPQTLNIRQPLRWRDQFVYAFGVRHEWSPRTTLRAGFNVLTQPNRLETMNPTLNVGQKSEFMVGFGRRLADGWRYDFTFEHVIAANQTYRNPAIPLGESARAKFEAFNAIVMFSRRW